MLVNVFYFLFGALTTVAVLLGYARFVMGPRIKAKVAEMKAEADKKLELNKQEQEKLAQARAWILDSIKKQQEGLVDTSPVPTTDGDVSVKNRLHKAIELTLKQLKIDTRKGPEAVLQHNELELEKLSLLKTILKDGFDPMITIRYNTGDQEMLLSTYVNSIQKSLA